MRWAGRSKQLKIFFFNISTTPRLENEKVALPAMQKILNFASWKITSKGATFLLGRSSRSQQNLN
jgi:hypothetical protein